MADLHVFLSQSNVSPDCASSVCSFSMRKCPTEALNPVASKNVAQTPKDLLAWNNERCDVAKDAFGSFSSSSIQRFHFCYRTFMFTFEPVWVPPWNSLDVLCCLLTGVGAVVFGPVQTSILAHLEIEALSAKQPGHYALQLRFCTQKTTQDK